MARAGPEVGIRLLTPYLADANVNASNRLPLTNIKWAQN
jgi:hypothetical protein